MYKFSNTVLKIHLCFILGVLLLITGCATPLHTAVSSGDIKTVTTLLDEGADANEKFIASTPLYMAAWYGQTEIARLLIDRGADVNMISNGNFSCLHAAVTKGHTDLVRLLIDRGADINISNGSETPLQVAKKEGHTLIVRILQEAEEELYQRNYAKVEKPSSSVSPKPSVAIKSDVDVLPVMQTKPNKNAYAIVIGIEKYRQKLPKADYADNDARIMAEYLTKVMGYPEENVVTLLNDRALKSDFEKYFEKWLGNNVEKDSSVFIYFSGHGAPNTKTGDAYLVPYDGDPTFIDQTGYSLKRMYDALGKLPAKEIVVALDSCFSGAGGRSVLAEGARPLVMNLQTSFVLTKNIQVMAAASGDQISSTYKDKGHGLFTYFMLNGIKNEDVLNLDGSIAISDLFNYIKPRVERIARKIYNNEQTPQLIAPNKFIMIR